jgi:hypothetical protein
LVAAGDLERNCGFSSGDILVFCAARPHTTKIPGA